MPDYKGRQLETIVNQRQDGQWTCRYLIVDPAKMVTDENKGQAPGSYATREEAEAAALHEGQRVIDSRPPFP
jgi:hypothetical protein